MITYITEMLLKVQQSEYLGPARPPEFRVSSLPYCPILNAYEWSLFDPKKPNVNEFRAGHYFRVGHAVHDNYQTTAVNALPKDLIGDYSCDRILGKEVKNGVETLKKCARLVKFCTPEDMAKHPCPHKFNDCSSYQRYSELEFTYKGLSGHCDFVLRERVGKKKLKSGKIKPVYRWHVADFKTTGNNLFIKKDEYVAKGYYPSKKYIEQIETYCVLIEHFYDIEIYDYTIAYVSREKPVHNPPKDLALEPFSYRWTSARRNARIAKLKTHLRNFKRFSNWKKNLDKPAIVDLVEHRPCQCKKDYDEKMSYHFFGDEKCPFYNMCIVGNEKGLKQEMLKITKEVKKKGF